MFKIKISPLGVTGGAAGGNGGQHGKRQKINGWSLQSARGNTRFLRSVLVDQLPPFGLAFTFTIRDMPTPKEWKRLKLKLVRALNDRFGCICWHMVTEWTKEGRPHLHGCAFWIETHADIVWDLEDAWLAYTKCYGTSERAQLVKIIRGADGWFIYMAKHAARGLGHYQRQADSLPPEWKAQTGRVWGRGGRWPTDVQENNVTAAEFYMFRRSTERYANSKARAELKQALKYGKPQQIKSARKRLVFLKKLRKAFGGGETASSIRGINEWVPWEVSGKLLRFALKENDTRGKTEDIGEIFSSHGLCETDIPY
ncbi:hypothetical protein [Gymnodinialimonas ceratoperidinii]|uniref:Replication protein n=1 Tax=Gymnodinialimonas ceratoperidinii TaxID=2856823 RepID=A0A8F6TVM8_9RHOB|nr:hypothetical protein [Gymnodinialimonas ceratoperidinii]QXT38744.1 hypothetical protein KYE46_12470 [Gymnodinialimonas ceratoperidinii]